MRQAQAFISPVLLAASPTTVPFLQVRTGWRWRKVARSPIRPRSPAVRMESSLPAGSDGFEQRQDHCDGGRRGWVVCRRHCHECSGCAHIGPRLVRGRHLHRGRSRYRHQRWKHNDGRRSLRYPAFQRRQHLECGIRLHQRFCVSRVGQWKGWNAHECRNDGGHRGSRGSRNRSGGGRQRQQPKGRNDLGKRVRHLYNRRLRCGHEHRSYQRHDRRGGRLRRRRQHDKPCRRVRLGREQWRPFREPEGRDCLQFRHYQRERVRQRRCLSCIWWHRHQRRRWFHFRQRIRRSCNTRPRNGYQQRQYWWLSWGRTRGRWQPVECRVRHDHRSGCGPDYPRCGDNAHEQRPHQRNCKRRRRGRISRLAAASATMPRPRFPARRSVSSSPALPAR